jgi:hypothetical protein
MNLNHVLKKVGRRSSDDLFKISYFLNLHALGHPKSVLHGIWVKLSLRMMCVVFYTLVISLLIVNA